MSGPTRYNSELPAVLVLAFNRPDVTARIIERTKSVGVTKLYVACDGPREGRPDDERNVAAIHEMVGAITWCDVKTLFRETNQGCGPNVSQAISWFLQETEEGIILEDDCLPHPSFYRFCAEMLDRYRGITNVMQVAGYNFLGGKYHCDYDYLFSNFGWQWGWATWKRAWEHFDLRLSTWPSFKKLGLHRSMPFYSERNETLDRVYQLNNSLQTATLPPGTRAPMSSWAYPWAYSVASNVGISVVPVYSLIENIGFGVNATHGTNAAVAPRYAAEIRGVTFPLRHYPFVMPEPEYDRRLIIAVHSRRSIRVQAIRRASQLRSFFLGEKA